MWDGEEEGEKGKKWVKISFKGTVLSLNQQLKAINKIWIILKFL